MLCAGNVAQIRQSVMSDKVRTNLGETDPWAKKWAPTMPPKPAAGRLFGPNSVTHVPRTGKLDQSSGRA
jgi:hypothetical protein